jgi:hypothetical protein
MLGLFELEYINWEFCSPNGSIKTHINASAPFMKSVLWQTTAVQAMTLSQASIKREVKPTSKLS